MDVVQTLYQTFLFLSYCLRRLKLKNSIEMINFTIQI